MTAAEFRAELRRLGLAQLEIADRLGVTPDTVSRWATGKVPVPRYAEYVLELLVALEAYRRPV